MPLNFSIETAHKGNLQLTGEKNDDLLKLGTKEKCGVTEMIGADG